MRKITVSILALLGMAMAYTGCKNEDDPIPASEIPTIATVSPGEGTIGTELTITGTNFNPGATVYIDGKASAQVEISSTEVIYALVPAGIPANTLVAVSVKNEKGGEATLKNAFKAINPLLSFVNSATKPSGNIGSTVILEGKAFGDVQGNGKVLFSDGAGGTIASVIINAEDWTDTFIITTVPQGANDGPVVIETEIGVSNAIDFNVTESATFSPSAINWTITTALPQAVSGHKAVFTAIDDATGVTQNYVHVSGGTNASGELLNSVLVGKINADGTVSEWTATTALPEARAFHSTVVATPFNAKVGGSGFIYVMGGIQADGAPVTTVSVAALDNTGAVTTWSSARPLPQALHSAGVVIFRSTLYVAGGSTVDNVPVATVYKASINESGELGEWQTLAALPSARTYHGFVTFGGHLYTVGGETGNVTPHDGNAQSNDTKISEVAYAKINLRTGDLTEGWAINENSLQKVRSKHTTVIAGGSIFVSSGLYSGAAQGSSENTYAVLASDGSVGSFAGATGSNTLSSVGGVNLFNHESISYNDADGVSHVMIIGGDNVNTVGQKTSTVLFY